MIKWENPMLISLSNATDARGICHPTGSGDSELCESGNSAGGRCDPVGNSADTDCVDGNSPGSGLCHTGTIGDQ